MKDVFEIIPEHAVEMLENMLQEMLQYQANMEAVEDRLLLNTIDADLLID